MQDPIFGYKVPNEVMGYPGGVFDPLGFSKSNAKEWQTKEIKNGRLAMVAYMGFVFAAQVWSAVCARNPVCVRTALRWSETSLLCEVSE